MYLQITTKCNMTCAHCCYSCNRKGKHADYSTVIDAIAFCRSMNDEVISIGGGEPTLHPRFFDILKRCLDDFNYVWFATNGSQTKTMFRLADILDGNDYGDNQNNPYNPDTDEDSYYEWQDEHFNGIQQENKLTVALSQDYFHNPIDDRIVDIWTKRANKHSRSSGYEIRNVTQSRNGIIKQGRAIRTGNWQDDKGCVCPDIIVKPDGSLRPCGCTKSPRIGDIWNGIDEKWKDIIQNDEGYRDTNCYKGINHKKEI